MVSAMRSGFISRSVLCMQDYKSVRGIGGVFPEFGVGDANANCNSPDFLMFQNFKDQIGCITSTMQKNVMTMLAVMATAYPSSPPSLEIRPFVPPEFQADLCHSPHI